MANEKTASAAKPSAPKKQKKSIVKYFKDARSEFKKVVWPSRKQVFNNTVVVIVAMVVSGVAIWGMDSIFIALIKLMLGK
ncbi:MAG: preprotein translocase subunit SecE [Bacteroides sp.]|nr:preprotein translocase subunit SecE [Eubacterium sp.]MCM1418735.1 preprotein translocase subunit SecE [Roseburia sp.]MCM1462802.1 preprotein translocase subunit SecE [Bacteroides sp.]